MRPWSPILSALALSAAAAFLAPALCFADGITSVTISGNSPLTVSPTITIDGSGFAPQPVVSVTPPGTGPDYGTALYFVEIGAPGAPDSFVAGMSGASADTVGLLISAYSSTEIVYTFSDYPTDGHFLKAGDTFETFVRDATSGADLEYTGTVAFAPEPSSLILLGTGLTGLLAATRRRLINA